MLTITGTNLATIKEPKMRAKYGAVKSENVSVSTQTPAHEKAVSGLPEWDRCRHSRVGLSLHCLPLGES